MRLASAISIYAGGAGSGCNPEVAEPRCGRPSGSGSSQEAAAFIEKRRPIFEKTMKEFRSNYSKYGKVEGRLKDADSLDKKAVRKGKSIEQAGNDAIGLRVTTSSIADVYRAVDDIKKNYNVVEQEDKIKRPVDGYRAIHLGVQIDGVMGEIQVRTENQSKWAMWAHDKLYKPPEGYGYLNKNQAAWTYAKKVSNALYRADQGARLQLPPCPRVLTRIEWCYQ